MKRIKRSIHSWPSFLTGAMAMLLLVALAIPALAASGVLRIGGPNLSVLGETVDGDERFTGENGAQIPVTITYTDELGGNSTFVSLRKVAELLDTSIQWDGTTNTVFFGEKADKGLPVILPGQSGVGPGNTVKEPKLGTQMGPFTEVAPRAEGEKGLPTVLLETTDFRSLTGFLNQRYYIFPEYGNYVEIEITNHGEAVGMLVSRPNFVSNGSRYGCFSNVRLEKGQTITRAFTLEEGAAFVQSFLRLDVEGIFDGQYHDTDITVKVTQYDKKG